MTVSYERKKIEKDEERNIIIGMIVSTDFLRQIQFVYNPDFFSLSFAKTVSRWCFDYYKKYQKAPEKDIQSIFDSQKDKIIDRENVEMISTFLSGISDKYENEGYNVEYNLDKATAYFRSASLDSLVSRIKGAQIMNDYDRAEAEVANYSRIAKDHCEGIEVWHDRDAAINTLREESKPIFRFPGELGRFIRPWERGEFVAIVGPGKRGKSTALFEIAFLCSLQNLNVAFFSFEMTKSNMLLRAYQRLTGLLTPNTNEDGREITIPKFDGNYDYNGAVNTKKEFRRTMEVKDILKKMTSMQSIIKNNRLKLICVPPNSMSVSDMETHLDNFEHYENWVPDVVIADYADITKPERTGEKRHQIDETWLAYRGLSLARHMLVVTASHSNKATYDRDVRQGDMSEDNRKLNHVTWAGALNQSDDEADMGVMRIGVLADRFGSFSKNTEAVILQCLDIGQFCLDSRIVRKEVNHE